ncbi:MAG: cytochrome c [Burkholderiales bacterium]|nr:cytochrome c [Burkholderiales bacterium]
MAAACTLVLSHGCGLSPAQPETDHSVHQRQLIRMVRQDCGSCHGMQLTGGLGPALTKSALRGKPLDSLAATIMQGRPGTPMPGWKGMISEADARWITEQLLTGFPQE